jgi:hypothetical protein
MAFLITRRGVIVFRRPWPLVVIPVVDCVFVPVIHFLFQVHDTGLLWAQSLLARRMLSDADTKLDIVISVFHQSETALAATFKHAAVIPAAQTNGAEATDHVGEDIEWVKSSVVRQESLNDFRADTEAECADDQSQVESAPAGGVQDPVEGDRQEEEGN